MKLENERDLFEEVEEIKDYMSHIDERTSAIIDILNGLDFKEVERLAKELKGREEKLQNVYDKLNVMINEYKGFVSIQRGEFKENCDVIRKFQNGLKKMAE